MAWKAENESKFAETTKKIADYEAKAKEGVAAYEVVVKALADYDEAIKKLEEKVGSEGREVPVYNGEDRTDVTYGDRIDACVWFITRSITRRTRLSMKRRATTS